MNYVILQNYCPSLPRVENIHLSIVGSFEHIRRYTTNMVIRKENVDQKATRLSILPQVDRLQTILDLFFYIFHNGAESTLLRSYLIRF